MTTGPAKMLPMNSLCLVLALLLIVSPRLFPSFPVVAATKEATTVTGIKETGLFVFVLVFVVA